MNSSLLELCNLIAEEGAKYAHQHKELFLDDFKETTGKAVPVENIDMIYKIFSFLNWAYANGVWSNLRNTTLRRDLMFQSMQSIVLKTSFELSEDKSNESVAFLASGLDQEFREYVQAYNTRIKELQNKGFEPDENTAMLCCLEWIKDHIDIDDSEMNVIVPQFNDRSGNIPRIEEIAKQVNLAASQRKKGFFSRLFSS